MSIMRIFEILNMKKKCRIGVWKRKSLDSLFSFQNYDKLLTSFPFYLEAPNLCFEQKIEYSFRLWTVHFVGLCQPEIIYSSPNGPIYSSFTLATVGRREFVRNEPILSPSPHKHYEMRLTEKALSSLVREFYTDFYLEHEERHQILRFRKYILQLSSQRQSRSKRFPFLI